MSLKTAIAALNASKKAYDEQLYALGDDAGNGIAEYLGAEIPPGFALEWKQYAPGFNDGDPCVFAVHDPVLFRLPTDARDEDGEPIAPEDMDEYLGDLDAEDAEEQVQFYGIEQYGTFPDYPAIDGLSREQLEKLAAAWCDLPEDMLEHAFGDGARVRVMSGGAHVRHEYDCGY